MSASLKQQISFVYNKLEFSTDPGFLLEDYKSIITNYLEPVRIMYSERQADDITYALIFI